MTKSTVTRLRVGLRSRSTWRRPRPKKHGFTWWLHEDRKRVYHEEHFLDGERHGIERVWNHNDRICRGYPKYWVAGETVLKRQYLRARKRDKTPPPYRDADQTPKRRLPSGL